MLNLSILGSGSGTNAQAIIDAIEENRLNARIGCILSDVEDAPILERARKHNIPAFHIDCAPFRTKMDGDAQERAIEILNQHQTEWVVLAGFMRIVKPGLLRIYPERVINLHPSLLPSFPGLDAGRQALEYGVRFTGCTVHFVDEGIDTGPIIHQRCVAVSQDDSLDSLMQKIHAEEHRAYPEVLQWIADGRLSRRGRRVFIN
jgi:phosphoribosylglycinamide formyltransferase-1